MSTSFVIFLVFIVIKGTEEKQALIFDRFTRSLFQLPVKIPKDMECGAWAIVCPAETPEEKKFVEENSFTKNALFVREIYHRGGKASEVKTDACKEAFKVSLTYNIKSFTFQVGFEIYYKLKDAAYFHIDNFEDYKSPAEIASSTTTTWSKAKYLGKQYYSVVKNAIGYDAKELWINENEKMGFAWIPLFKFEFDSAKKILKKLTYYIGPNSRWPVNGEQCDDYNLGFEFYEDIDENIYSQTEENIFKHFKLPPSINCNSNRECFQRWSIVPISQFRFGTSTAPLCSMMATVPIWKETHQEFLLKHMDRYLYSLYQVIGEPLRIIAGTADEVELPKKWSLGKSTLFLDPAKKMIPVPRIIYKIIEYRLKNCKLEEKLCWYSAVVVIHNHPSSKSAQRLCSKEIINEWGWNGLLREPCEFIYVCPRNIQGTKLKLSQTQKITADLKLSHFPISDDGETIIPKDIRDEVKKKFDKLFVNGDELGINENRIVEFIPRNDFEWANEELAGAAEQSNEETKGKAGES